MTKGSRIAIAWALAGALAPDAGAEEPQAAAPPAQPVMEMMRQHDQKLDDLVAKMNAAKGEAKVDAIAAVLNEMVAQRKDMRKHMTTAPGMRGPMMRRLEQKAAEPKEE